jgi:hypothetical protein
MPVPPADVSAPVPTPAPVAEVQPVSAPVPAPKEVALVLDPRGTGDPDAVTCRVPQQLPGSRLPGPAICKANRLWAELRARHEDIMPDGRQVIALDAAERNRMSYPTRCQAVGRGSTSQLFDLPTSICF